MDESGENASASSLAQAPKEVKKPKFRSKHSDLAYTDPEWERLASKSQFSDKGWMDKPIEDLKPDWSVAVNPKPGTGDEENKTALNSPWSNKSPLPPNESRLTGESMSQDQIPGAFVIQSPLRQISPDTNADSISYPKPPDSSTGGLDMSKVPPPGESIGRQSAQDSDTARMAAISEPPRADEDARIMDAVSGRDDEVDRGVYGYIRHNSVIKTPRGNKIIPNYPPNVSENLTAYSKRSRKQPGDEVDTQMLDSETPQRSLDPAVSESSTPARELGSAAIERRTPISEAAASSGREENGLSSAEKQNKKIIIELGPAIGRQAKKAGNKIGPVIEIDTGYNRHSAAPSSSQDVIPSPVWEREREGAEDAVFSQMPSGDNRTSNPEGVLTSSLRPVLDTQGGAVRNGDQNQAEPNPGEILGSVTQAEFVEEDIKLEKDDRDFVKDLTQDFMSDLTGFQQGLNEGSGEQKLKTVEYAGFWSRENNGRVVYERRGNVIIFSALFPAGVADGKTSTVNAAEAVIAAICKMEGIDMRAPSFTKDYSFYDWMTPRGYPNSFTLNDGWELSKLELERLSNGGVHVSKWNPILKYEPTFEEQMGVHNTKGRQQRKIRSKGEPGR